MKNFIFVLGIFTISVFSSCTKTVFLYDDVNGVCKKIKINSKGVVFSDKIYHFESVKGTNYHIPIDYCSRMEVK